jgi:hypothetical protein
MWNVLCGLSFFRIEFYVDCGLCGMCYFGLSFIYVECVFRSLSLKSGQ